MQSNEVQLTIEGEALNVVTVLSKLLCKGGALSRGNTYSNLRMLVPEALDNEFSRAEGRGSKLEPVILGVAPPSILR